MPPSPPPAPAAAPAAAGDRRARLRILHVEDSPPDHDLVAAHLERAGLVFDALRVDSEAGLREALESADGWDVVLSDFKLPGFSGLRAQKIVAERGLDLPFILVSGEIGEDTAVEAMRAGATDYLLKHNLARLAPAVEHAVRARRERQAHREADRQLAASREQLSALARHLQASIEMERAAIAREIHDDVGGSLTALNHDLAWIDRHAERPELRQRTAAALETLAHAIGASQRIMMNLRPAILEQGLVPALQWMARGHAKRHGGLDVRFETSHESMRLPHGVPLVAYRFAQEALTNVVKHAQATKVVIDLSLARGVLSLEVSDNGRGLAPSDLDKPRSFGLRGLSERAQTVGGWVDVSSTDAGTVLMLSVPVGSGDGGGGFEADDDHRSGWGELDEEPRP